MMPFQPESWTTGELLVNAKGGKSCNIVCEGETPKFRFATPENPIHSPYGAGAWDLGSTRLNLDFAITDDLRPFLVQLDNWAKQTIKDNSMKFFGKKLKEVDSVYTSCIKQHSKGGIVYADTVRCKLNTQGARTCRFWDEKHNKIEMPELKLVPCVPLVEVRGFWFNNNSCGLNLEISDLLCKEVVEKACPWD